MTKHGGRTRNVQINIDGEAVEVMVTLRDTDRLAISVHPDLRVTATAPLSRPFDEVVQRIHARTPWIHRQRQQFLRYKPDPTRRRYVSGETHLYLGRQYRLRVRLDHAERVKMERGYITVYTRGYHDTEHVGHQLDRWYKQRADDVLRRRCDGCLVALRSLHLGQPAVVLRKMRTRWGSCTPFPKIILNRELVKVPVHCIDYVIIHELCHLKVLHHNARFYALLGRYMPDWEKRKGRLDGIVLPLD